MILSQEMIDQAISDSVPNVLRGLREEIQEQSLRAAKEVVYSNVRTAVDEWVKANVVPDIIGHLTEHKEGIVSISGALAPQIVEALTTSIADSLKKKLENSWERKKVFEALLS